LDEIPPVPPLPWQSGSAVCLPSIDCRRRVGPRPFLSPIFHLLLPVLVFPAVKLPKTLKLFLPPLSTTFPPSQASTASHKLLRFYTVFLSALPATPTGVKSSLSRVNSPNSPNSTNDGNNVFGQLCGFLPPPPLGVLFSSRGRPPAKRKRKKTGGRLQLRRRCELCSLLLFRALPPALLHLPPQLSPPFLLPAIPGLWSRISPFAPNRACSRITQSQSRIPAFVLVFQFSCFAIPSRTFRLISAFLQRCVAEGSGSCRKGCRKVYGRCRQVRKVP